MTAEQRKNTALATIRFDIRTLATIARFYTLKDQSFRSKSDIINQILCDFEALLISGKLVDKIDRTDEANLFLSNLNLNFRHKSTDAQYLKQLTIESLAHEEGSPDELPDVGKIKETIERKM